MIEMEQEQSRLPKGQRIHNRQKLSEARRTGDPQTIRDAEAEVTESRTGLSPAELKRQELVRRAQAERAKDQSRIEQLRNTHEGNAKDQAARELEALWLEIKLAGTDERNEGLKRVRAFLDTLEQRDPITADWLSESTEEGKNSRAMTIRNKVLPQATK